MPTSGTGIGSQIVWQSTHEFYPTVADLQAKLIAAGIFTNPPSANEALLDLRSAIGGAIEQWEALTGFQPFLADTVDTTRYFDGDGSYVVDLKGGYVSITSVSANANGCVANQDYRTMPLNARADNKPITYLDFRGWTNFRPFPALLGQTGPVAVTGRRGAFERVPNNAWNAILALAGIQLSSDIQQLITDGTIKRWKVGTDEEEYVDNPMQSLVAGWQTVVDRALKAPGNKRFNVG